MFDLKPKKSSVCTAISAVSLLVGCDTGSNGYSPVVTSVASTPPWQGYFSGEVSTEDGLKLYGEGLLTQDGLIRILIDPPRPWDTVVENSQFVGEVQVSGNRAEGSGILIGQGCTTVSAGRFCGSATEAQIVFDDGAPGKLGGELTFTDGTGSNSWAIDMSWTSSILFLRPASPERALGLYEETLAEFVGDQPRDTVVRVDADGRLFFQSANSDCTANGALSPHLDGQVNVWDATLTLGNCSGTYQSLNGIFTGLATRTPGDFPWEGGWLVMFLSTPLDEPPQVAITMWANTIQ